LCGPWRFQTKALNFWKILEENGKTVYYPLNSVLGNLVKPVAVPKLDRSIIIDGYRDIIYWGKHEVELEIISERYPTVKG